MQTHQQQPGAHIYKDYSKEKLEECLEKIKAEKISQREASATYKVPKSTT